MPNVKDFLEKMKQKQMKKSDWLLLALAGVLLLVIAIPTGGGDKEEQVVQKEAADYGSVTDGNTESQTYVASLEKELEGILRKMEGVGDVKVMITAEDNGENVVEKDAQRNTSTTAEKDERGGERSVSESNQSSSTVFVESGNEKYPYVQKELLPVIKGVVIVAEGGGDSHVKTNITEAVQALFPVEAHRVKVVAMGRKN